MNIAKLVVRPWVITFATLLAMLLLLLLPLTPRYVDGFVNYPQQVDPTANRKSNANTGAAEANDHYAAILMFIRENPTQAAGFLTDVKRKFFNEACTIRSDMDLVNLVNFSDGVPFR